jgi:hypothetical protein
MKKMSKKELLYKVAYNPKESFLLMPNCIFDILSKDEELMEKKAPHIAVAYTFTYFITWLYRYAKYSTMNIDDTDIKGIKRLIGYSTSNKELNYIIKKDGVLDRLGITKTLSFNEAPVQWFINENYKDVVEWNYFKEMNESLKEIGKNINTKRKQIKEPLLATNKRIESDIEFYGTFFDKEYTHHIPFDVFIECMTNSNLGCTAFYIYGYLSSRCGMNGGHIQVSVETISKKTGIRPTSRNNGLDALKKYGLIECLPENFIIERGEYKTDANTYWVNKDPTKFRTIPRDYLKRKVIHISQHINGL